MKTVDRTKFPANLHNIEEDGVSFVDKLLQEATVVGEGNIPIPLGYSARAQAAMDNPIAHVTMYKKLVHDVLEVLIGITPEHFQMGISSATTSDRRTKYYRQRKKGIFGRPLAYYGVNEDHAKGTLHNHIAMWGGLNPHLLQRYGGFQKVCDVIACTLDSMYATTLPHDLLIQKIVVDVLKDAKCKNDLLPERFQKNNCHLLRNLQWCKDMNREPVDIDTLALNDSLNDQTMDRQWHRCCHTCRKGMNGNIGCRLCKPSGTSETTRPIVLEADRIIDKDTGRVLNVEPVVVPISDAFDELEELSDKVEDHQTRNPLIKRKEDEKLLVWELK